jgi:hypothetical protein
LSHTLAFEALTRLMSVVATTFALDSLLHRFLHSHIQIVRSDCNCKVRGELIEGIVI